MAPIVLLPASERPRAAAVFARAFQEDPAMVWAVPDAARRARCLLLIYAAIHRAFGERITMKRVAGTDAYAEWAEADDADTSQWALARAGIWRLPFVAGLPALDRLMALGDATDAARRQNAPRGALFLMRLGVDPALQRRGYGRALVEEGLERARQRGSAVYLDTENPDAARLYERLGFTEVGQTQAAPDSPPTRAYVWRE